MSYNGLATVLNFPRFVSTLIPDVLSISILYDEENLIIQPSSQLLIYHAKKNALDSGDNSLRSLIVCENMKQIIANN